MLKRNFYFDDVDKKLIKTINDSKLPGDASEPIFNKNAVTNQSPQDTNHSIFNNNDYVNELNKHMVEKDFRLIGQVNQCNAGHSDNNINGDKLAPKTYSGTFDESNYPTMNNLKLNVDVNFEKKDPLRTSRSASIEPIIDYLEKANKLDDSFIKNVIVKLINKEQNNSQEATGNVNSIGHDNCVNVEARYINISEQNTDNEEGEINENNSNIQVYAKDESLFNFFGSMLLLKAGTVSQEDYSTALQLNQDNEETDRKCFSVKKLLNEIGFKKASSHTCDNESANNKQDYLLNDNTLSGQSSIEPAICSNELTKQKSSNRSANKAALACLSYHYAPDSNFSICDAIEADKKASRSCQSAANTFKLSSCFNCDGLLTYDKLPYANFMMKVPCKLAAQWRANKSHVMQLQFHERLHEEILSILPFMDLDNSGADRRAESIAAFASLTMSIWPKCKLVPFGSYATGCSLYNADIDLCLINLPETAKKKQIFYQLRHYLECLDFIDKPIHLILHAKVPIARFTYIDLASDKSTTDNSVKVDVCLDYKTAVWSTCFTRMYLKMIPEIRPLLMLLKLILQEAGLSETYLGGVGSFMSFLMILHHFQSEKQGKYKLRNVSHKTFKVANQTFTDYSDDDNNVPLNLGSQLMAFLRRYIEFDYDNYAIDLRHQMFLTKRKVTLQDSNKLTLSIVSPINPDTDVGTKSYLYCHVLELFKTLYSNLSHLLSDEQKAIKSKNEDLLEKLRSRSILTHLKAILNLSKFRNTIAKNIKYLDYNPYVPCPCGNITPSIVTKMNNEVHRCLKSFNNHRAAESKSLSSMIQKKNSWNSQKSKHSKRSNSFNDEHDNIDIYSSYRNRKKSSRRYLAY